jgi:hypothetical protein
MVRHIPLGPKTATVVDDADYDQINAYNWFLSGTGYAVAFVPVDGRFKLTYLHRFLMDAQPGEMVDHCNGDALDNRRNNLRLATPQQNGQNKRLSPLSTTGLKGVGWHKRRGRYHARIQLQGIRYHLGFFDDAETAALAYDAAARRLFGAFAMCNYPHRETPHSMALQVRDRLQRRGLKLP